MTVELKLDKLMQLATVPRMVGDTDIELVRSLGKALAGQARIVEFGPWLGGVSTVLAEYGTLSVVDRFLWSDENNEAYPGMAKVDTTFRPLFEHVMAEHDFSVDIHETTFCDFTWAGGKIDMCFIDGPRRPSDLLDCLKPIAAHLSPDAPVMIKNGLSVQYLEMMALIEVLAGLKIFECMQTGQPRWCNIVVVKPGPRVADLARFQLDDNTFREHPVNFAVSDPWGGSLMSAARLGLLVSRGEWAAAYRSLMEFPADPENLYMWDQIESNLVVAQEEAGRLAAFSEIFAAHNSAGLAFKGLQQRADMGLVWVLRSWWLSNAAFPERRCALDPDLLSMAFDQGHMLWPSRLQERLKKKRVVEIGKPEQLLGLGYLDVGVQSYLGGVVGDLNQFMMKLEESFDDITFLPLQSVNEAAIEGSEVVLVHAEVAESVAVREALLALSSTLAPDAELLILPETGETPKRFRL
jgi:hypothetical protein